MNLSRKAKAEGYRRYANAAGIDHFGTAIVKTCYSAQDADDSVWAPAQVVLASVKSRLPIICAVRRTALDARSPSRAASAGESGTKS